MDSNDRRLADAANLRMRAEKTARMNAALFPERSIPLSPEEAQLVIYELRVHQIELEMQNEELLRTQAELVEARARYFDLFDLAPVGYCTLGEQGTILEANLTAATLLGVNRAELVKQAITRFIHKADQDVYYRYLKRVINSGEALTCELRMLNQDGTSFWARLMATVVQDAELGLLHKIVISDITESRKAEEALRTGERLYHAIGESIDYGVWVCDPTGRNVYASESFLKLIGYTQKRCSDFGWADALHPDEAATTIAAWKKCVATGGSWDCEHRFLGVDGGWHHVLARGVPVKNERGEITFWTGINLNITDLKNAEEKIGALNTELNARLEEMNTLLEILPVGVWTSNRDGSEMLGNPAAYRLMRLTNAPNTSFTNPERFLPGVRVSIDGAEIPLEDSPMARVGRTGEAVHNLEYQLLFADGTKTTTYASAVPLFDKSGNVRKVVGAYADITELKNIEDSLRESKERCNLALQVAKMATWDWNLVTDVMVWNEDCFRMFGYEVDSIKPSVNAWMDRVHADDRATIESVFHSDRNALENGGIEFRTCWPNGSVHWHWTLGDFARDAAGNVVRSHGVLLDITEKKEAEQRIQKLNEDLLAHVATVDAVNRELDSYSHSVSHDLRTPLRFVNKIAYLLLHEAGSNLSTAATQQVNMILQATSEMGQLIENLLLFSQVSRDPMTKSFVDMRRLFAKIVKELRAAQEDRSIEIEIQDLAPCQGDRTLLNEVVANLLGNALKFTRRRERARILVGCTKEKDEAVYFVQDNGAGFDMAAADSLFVPFHRLHKPAEFEGTGIGLALVKRIVERHGGRIWAEAAVDVGATFYFTLGAQTTG